VPRALAQAPDEQTNPVGSARANLRGHLLKGAARLVALLLVDLAAIVAARLLLLLVHDGVLGQGAGQFLARLLPAAEIPGGQLVVAVAVSFFFLGCYRDGDRWREPVRMLTASAIGVGVAFYSDLWHGPTAAVAGRGLLVWLLLGPLLVAARSLAGVLSNRFAPVGMEHRVLEVTSGVSNGCPDLGPSYRLVASLDQAGLSPDLGVMERWLRGGSTRFW
jgi:hypothetical protein